MYNKFMKIKLKNSELKPLKDLLPDQIVTVSTEKYIMVEAQNYLEDTLNKSEINTFLFQQKKNSRISAEFLSMSVDVSRLMAKAILVLLSQEGMVRKEHSWYRLTKEGLDNLIKWKNE